MNKAYAEPQQDNQNQDAQTQITVPVQNQQAAASPSFSENDIQNMIQQQIEPATAPFGSNTGYVAVSGIVLSLLVVIILLLIRNSLLSRINNLTKDFKELKEKNSRFANLDKEIATLSGENYELRNRLESLENKIRNTPSVEVRPQVNFQKAPPLTASPYAAPPPPTLLDKCKDFIADFNALNNFAPNERRGKRNEFFNKYQIRAFNCKNYNERMNNPALEPQFEIAAQAINGEYWAYEVESNIFAVVPNVKNYNDNYHGARAMVFVFDSNFSGGNYANIRVVKPAIFKGMWRLGEKGELVLS